MLYPTPRSADDPYLVMVLPIFYARVAKDINIFFNIYGVATVFASTTSFSNTHRYTLNYGIILLKLKTTYLFLVAYSTVTTIRHLRKCFKKVIKVLRYEHKVNDIQQKLHKTLSQKTLSIKKNGSKSCDIVI